MPDEPEPYSSEPSVRRVPPSGGSSAPPRVSPRNDPPALGASQLSPVLRPRGHDRRNGPLDQQRSHGVALGAPIGDQPLGLAALRTVAADAPVLQRRLQAFDLRRGSLLHLYSAWSPRAIGQDHELCSLASCRLPDQRPPFLAGMHRPSLKHSSPRPFCGSSRWSKQARHRCKSTSAAAQAVNHRWTVRFAPYRAGHALHGSPVPRIHRIPSKHRRSSAGGRPPFVRRLRRGSCS
jgi:hypothetical protein